MHDSVLETATEWLRQGMPVALATVVETWGSSPRPAGSLLAVNGQGGFTGSVSGGCIEAAVISEAQQVIQSGAPRTLEFGVSDTQAWEAGLACGGRLRVHVRALGADTDLVPLLGPGPVAMVTRLEDGASCLIQDHGTTGELSLDAGTLAEAQRALAAGRSRLLESAAAGTFVLVVTPPWRMIIVGAVHITRTLAPLAELLGFSVCVIDPRRAFATSERMPDTLLLHGWPDEEMQRLGPDARTAIVVLTHDSKIDDPALAAALESPAYYIGALGSRRNHERRLVRLGGLGFDAAELGRINGPAGLDIGAESPAEIALAIVAQAVAARRRAGP